MKKFSLALAMAGALFAVNSRAISLNDIQLWTGSGTNRAAMIIEWNSPVSLDQTTVPAPIATKTMVWGYRFNGTATGTQMFDAIVAADRRLYATQTIDPTYGPGIDAIGYNLDGSGQYGVSDGTNTYRATNFVNGILSDATLGRDAAVALDAGDLFWSGHFGPNWTQWSEGTYSGGFSNSPNRGSSPYYDTNTYSHGDWGFGNGLDGTTLFDGSWMGFTVAGAGYTTNNANDLAIYNADEQAPADPDGTYTAYVVNTNDFATQITSTSNVYSGSPYNDPTAMLGRPTLKFYDSFLGGTTDRVSVINPPFNVTPSGGNVITEISSNGQITVNMGRKIYDDPGNPYGIDFIIYGNSLLTSSTGSANDNTDLSTALVSQNYKGHSNIVSVSQDGTNWYTYSSVAIMFPQNAYRWDETNQSWNDEQSNPTKPVNPAIYTQNFIGTTVAGALDHFAGAAGGTGYALTPSGYPWIKYIRVQPQTNNDTVIDAIAAVNPVVVGGALTLGPGNVSAGVTNLTFRKQDGSSNTLIGLSFSSLSGETKVSTITLSDFSSYGPVAGNVSSAYQITAKPMNGGSVSYSANVGLRAGAGYAGNGSDLRLYQWTGTNWARESFVFNTTNNEVVVAGVTNLSAFVVAQTVAPQLMAGRSVSSNGIEFTPMPNVPYTLLRSVDFVTWTNVANVTPPDANPVTLQDSAPPAGKAFYRVSAMVP